MSSKKQSLLSNVIYHSIILSGKKKKFFRENVQSTLKNNRAINLTPHASANKIRITSTITSDVVANMTTYTVGPQNPTSKKTIIYLHGGAYTGRIASQQWTFIDELVRNTNSTLIVPMYPLAPNESHDVAFECLLSLYQSLLLTTDPLNITIMGDSAGGGLALAFSQYLRDLTIKGPSQIFLLSPWLDIALKNPEVKAYEKLDAMLAIDGLVEIGKVWAGDQSTSHYKVSPINGSLDGLGQITLFTGTKDLLYPDCHKFYKNAQQKGTHINYYEYPNMFHVWMIVTVLEESKDVMAKITDLLGSIN